MLDIECFTYLNALLESPMAPTVILATNRGHSLVRGTTEIVAPHGIPVDLLDRYAYRLPPFLGPFCSLTISHDHRCLFVKTERYSKADIAKVVQLRASVEGLQLGSGVLDKLAERGETSSLRQALYSLSPTLLC